MHTLICFQIVKPSEDQDLDFSEYLLYKIHVEKKLRRWLFKYKEEEFDYEDYRSWKYWYFLSVQHVDQKYLWIQGIVFLVEESKSSW